eukprot:GDKI01000053.1.p1 GENE.GDKI01000053.1~~GDKI01000053.1.p1  ORF type:complete len:209 (-),score=43.98 GDKI01000053.1:169-795(-)
MDAETKFREMDWAGIVRKSLVQRIFKDRPLYHQIEDFVSAIGWGEPLIVGLLSMNAVILVLILLTRKHFTFRAVLFFVIAGLVSSSKYINAWCRTHWEAIATQNYFDEDGVFCVMFFAGPLLCWGFWLVICMVWSSGELLIEVKRRELKDALKKRRTKNEANSSAADGAADTGRHGEEKQTQMAAGEGGVQQQEGGVRERKKGEGAAE